MLYPTKKNGRRLFILLVYEIKKVHVAEIKAERVKGPQNEKEKLGVHFIFYSLRLLLLRHRTSDVSDLAALCLRSIKDDEKLVCIVVISII